jgi:selenide, water dikinase
LRGLPKIEDPNVIAGIEHFEDAGVYRLRDDLALIQTIDFFTPIVDDPFTFGRIAAANALSDVYAMGGKPLTAMNVICFPVKSMDISILHDILLGGMEILSEAQVTLIGGHSVEDNELKYGLSVSGVIHPDKVVRNRGARPGDKLVLTKALGTGIVSTAIKGGEAPPELAARSIESMTTLNRTASEIMLETPGIHACTDITGFGFLGHACEMIEGSDTGMLINITAVPVFNGVQELVREGYVPGGLYRNKEFRMHMLEFERSCPDISADFLFDPQTSGGLLISIEAAQAEKFLKRLLDAGVRDAAIVGEVVAEPRGKILVI